MITLHCPCGETLQAEPGPPAVTCRCGRAHRLPGSAPRVAAPAAALPPPPPVPAAAPAPAPPPPPPPPPAEEPRRPSVNPLQPARRQAIHDGFAPPAPAETGWKALLRSPAAAGAASVGVLLVALTIALVLRARANRLKGDAEAGSGTECSFIGTGVAFTAPPSWKLVKKENLTFEFAAPEGNVSVTVLQITQESHEQRLRTAEPNAAWAAGVSEVAGAEYRGGSWAAAAGVTEGASWWFERGTHRLWIYASGPPGVRAAVKPLFAKLNLNAPLEPPAK